MTFGGTFGPGGNLIPFGLIFNLQGEAAAGYDADGRVRFTSKSGQVYTPARVDTLLIQGAATEASVLLGALVAGGDVAANADVGTLATGVPGVTEHGLPTNFGPGRGNWDEISGVGDGPGPFALPRLRLTYMPKITAPVTQPGVASLGQGSVQTVDIAPVAPSNVSSETRNFHGVELDKLLIIVECLHSVQG